MFLRIYRNAFRVRFELDSSHRAKKPRQNFAILALFKVSDRVREFQFLRVDTNCLRR